MDKKYDIFGIGSPLIDMIVDSKNEDLELLSLKKGQMHLIDLNKLIEIKNNQSNIIKTNIAGDVVNTIMGVSAIGGKGAFCGKVGNGKYGDLFLKELETEGINPLLTRCDSTKTGMVVSFVTPDGERTMTTFLGASICLKKEEANLESLKESKFLYTSGYVLDSEDLTNTVMEAIKIAKDNNVKIAFDLADPGVVDRHRDMIKYLLRDYIDIVFANETEAKAFTSKEPLEALNELSNTCEIAIVKIGDQGSLIKRGDQQIKVDILKEKAIDTTGAGDMYAAGFLYSLANNDNLDVAGKVASFASAQIVKQFGAKLETDIKNDIIKLINGESVILEEE